jgi:hypothetical protein
MPDLPDVLVEKMARAWRSDMENAPRDGTPILAWAPDSMWEAPFIVRWFDDDLDPDDSGWFERPDFTGGPVDVEITHFMPLPPPPSQTGEE